MDMPFINIWKMKEAGWGRIGERPRDYFGNPKCEIPDKLPNGDVMEKAVIP